MNTAKRLRPVRRWVGRQKVLIGIIGGGLLLALIAVQLAYPVDRALPFARLDGQSLNRMHRNEIAGLIETKFQESKVVLKVGDQTHELFLKGAGASPNTETTIAALTDYPLWQRLIPFSLIAKRPQVEKVDVYFDKPLLEKQAAQAVAKLKKSPVDARLTIKKGKLTVTAAKPGYALKKDSLVDLLSRTDFNFNETIVALTPEEIPPARSDADVNTVKKQAEATIAKKITINGPDGKVFRPSRSAIASWLSIGVQPDKSLKLKVNESQVQLYANNVNKKVRVDPGATRITVVDGEETSRQGGSVGQEAVTEQLVAELKAVVLSGNAEQTITLKMRPLVSVIVSDRRYTSSQKGLQAYVNYVTSSQDVRISLIQLDGNHWSAAAREYESTPSASTFKVFLALVLFDEMSKGKIHWEDPMLGTNVAGCFEQMTVASTNPCAEAWIAQFGREYINNFLYARGFSSGTSFLTNGWAIRTTAADLTKYMVGLHTGSLVGGAYRDRLLDSLGRHPYRYGVPTGSAGVVHDKVGFLWDYVHDAAIVQHPRGTYIVTIMTKGQSYARIAQITRELESIMYP